MKVRLKVSCIMTMLVWCMAPFWSHAEDGHLLWLRMKDNSSAAKVMIDSNRKSPTIDVAVNELQKHWYGKEKIQIVLQGDTNDDAFSISREKKNIVLRSSSPNGILYATYHLLRQQVIGGEYNATERPTHKLRILNHWDNPDGTVERGYAGQSIWKWDRIPAKTDAKMPSDLVKLYTEYARANASVGINATVLNNVNAKPMMLSHDMIAKTARIANILRPYGIRVFVSVNFASPKALGEVETADPLHPTVIKWWKKKAKEIYEAIPDFGGFLVKANSEGEPGPMDYDRTHADGANMLADALMPYHGIVMWRAFVYSAKGGDRASQACEEFIPFDGQFRNNVIIQIKNGPIDFQPREPVNPLFFCLKKTQMMPEFQITQEYLGQSVHTAFLASMWNEFYQTLSAVGEYDRKHGDKEFFSKTLRMNALAGVANIGDDVNWCGSDMAQANWYAFGRMAWNHDLSPEQIAKEWLIQTYTSNEAFVIPMTQMMVETYEAVVNYMMPLGLHHIFAAGHHYGPEPWCYRQGWREDWLPRYYHKADSAGLGFERSMKGSGNTQYYPEPLKSTYDNEQSCPDNMILWFHHISWNQTMGNGQTMWTNLCNHYDKGVEKAAEFSKLWKQMEPYIDSARFMSQDRLFEQQAKDAWWWRDACLLYFQQFSSQALPSTSPAPRHTLKNLQEFTLNIDNYSKAILNVLP